MRWIERIQMAMLALFRRGSETVRLNDELQFHLDQEVAENTGHGIRPEQAHAAALRAFGNPTLVREEARASWSWNWFEKLVRDVSYGSPTLGLSPGFAAMAIIVIA